MIKELQVLWYLKKDDFLNYCIDFKPYKNKTIEGYEISKVDEDLIYELCDKNPDELDVIGYFQSENELKRHIKNHIESKETDLKKASKELEDKINSTYETITWSGEDYYISMGSGSKGSAENKVLNWYDALKEEYSKARDIWILWITGYDAYDLATKGNVLTYVLSDILNLPESYFDEMIPDKGWISKEKWNKVIKRMEDKYHFSIGLKKAI